MFGMSFAELKKQRKAIGIDHDLACGHGATGCHDAWTRGIANCVPGATAAGKDARPSPPTNGIR